MSNTKNNMFSDSYGSYGNYAEENSDWLNVNYYHVCVYPDTGFAKSWCKVCSSEGLYNFHLGKYIKTEEKQ